MDAISIVAALAVGVGLGALAVWAARRRRDRDDLERLRALMPVGPGTTGRSGRLGRSTVGEATAALEGHRVELARSQAEERRLRTVFDHLQLGVVVTDGRGFEVLRNASANRLLGSAQSDAVASHALRRVLDAGREGRVVTETAELLGPRRVVVLHGAPLATGVVAVVEDVTERRRIDAIRRDFVSNISHELRTPVGALAVLAETLAESDRDEDPETMRRLASRIDLEAHRLTEMVDDLLSLASIEADETGQQADLDVTHVVAEAVKRVEPSARTRGTSIVVGEPETALVVHGDRRQLVSAVHNLLENALKYSDKGEPVRVESGACAADGMAEIRVIDRGIGIPLRDRERIFERFYRVDRARHRDTGGTGLGLAIVRHVAMNHGGDVRVESLEGEGSTFVLRIPLSGSGADGTGEAGGAIGTGGAEGDAARIGGGVSGKGA